MDWIVTTGATVEEALENALDELSVTSDDVEYEVLKESKKTLFGFRTSEAQIRTRVRPVAVPAKRERRRPVRSDKRKAAKTKRPRATSGKQKQQRGVPKQRSQQKQTAQEPAQSSKNSEASAPGSSTRKRTLTTAPKHNEQSNVRSTTNKEMAQPTGKGAARRIRKIDH